MNSLMRSVISIRNKSSNNAEEIMYNYKFEEDITDKVMSVCDVDDKFSNLLDKISKINFLFDENIVQDKFFKLLKESFLNSNKKEKTEHYEDNKKQKRKVNKPLGKYININFIDAFDESVINEYTSYDDKVSLDIQYLEFALNSLLRQKQRALSDFDIVKALKFNDEILNIKRNLQQVNDDLKKVNDEILTIEKDYESKFDALASEFSDIELINLPGVKSKYGDKIIGDFFIAEIAEIINQYLESENINNVEEFINNPKLKEILGDNYSRVVGNIKK